MVALIDLFQKMSLSYTALKVEDAEAIKPFILPPPPGQGMNFPQWLWNL